MSDISEFKPEWLPQSGTTIERNNHVFPIGHGFFNSDTGKQEEWDGTAWKPVSSATTTTSSVSGTDPNSLTTAGIYYFDASSSSNVPPNVSQVAVKVTEIGTFGVIQDLIDLANNRNLQRHYDGSTWSGWAVGGTGTAPKPVQYRTASLPVGSFVMQKNQLPTSLGANYRDFSVLWENSDTAYFVGGSTAGAWFGALTKYTQSTDTYGAIPNAFPPQGSSQSCCMDTATGTLYALSVNATSSIAYSSAYIRLFSGKNGVLTELTPAGYYKHVTTVVRMGYRTTVSANSAPFILGYSPQMWYNNNRIYLYSGGTGGDTSISNLLRIDLATSAVTSIAMTNGPALNLRAATNSVFDSSSAYVFSGFTMLATGLTAANHAGFFKFDFATETWTQIIASGEPAPSDYTGAMIGTDIYYMKVNQAAPFVPSTTGLFYKFDTLTNTWSDLSTLLTAQLMGNVKFPNVRIEYISSDGTNIHIWTGYHTSVTTPNANTYHWVYRPAIGYSSVAAYTTPAPVAYTTGNDPVTGSYFDGTNIGLVSATGLVKTYNPISDTWGTGVSLGSFPNSYNEVAGITYITHNKTGVVTGELIQNVYDPNTHHHFVFTDTTGVVRNVSTGIYAQFLAIGSTVWNFNPTNTTTPTLSFLDLDSVSPTTMLVTGIPVSGPLTTSASLAATVGTDIYIWTNTVGSQSMHKFDTLTNTYTTFLAPPAYPTDVVYNHILALGTSIFMVGLIPNVSPIFFEYDTLNNTYTDRSGDFYNHGTMAGGISAANTILATDGVSLYLAPIAKAIGTFNDFDLIRYVP